ncbi:hypothetical protein ABQF34_12865 [Mycolicibacterium boenickei]
MSTNERQVLVNYFRDIDGGDVVALPPWQAGYDQSEGHDEAREEATRRGVADAVWMFWHRQAAAAFDAQGQLTGPLRINWGGDHHRVAQLLAGLPEPFRVKDNGAGGVFEITSTAVATRAEAPFPAVADTAEVKARVKLITSQKAEERTDAEWAWLNRVLVDGDRAAQGYVVRHLAGAEQLTDEALETLMADWVSIYAKSPTDVLIWDLLCTLRKRSDPRLDDLVAKAAKRKRWTFAAGVAHFLSEVGDPAGLPLLYELALTPGPYEHTPGNGAALRGWVRIRAEHEGRSVADVASEALRDPAFDAAARNGLQKIIDAGRV